MGIERRRPSQKPTAPMVELPTPDEKDPPIFRVGEVLNGVYEIRGLLGAGGMGEVYEAHDQLLSRRVAIKAAHPGLGAPPLRDEARALAAFRHPSLVTVHTMGTHRGVEYLVMERIYGVSLAEHLSHRMAGPTGMTIAEVLDLLLPVSDGLAVVHRAGIAHRDIKPANIMLAIGHRVVLMDFGLVLPEFDVAAHENIMGSPLYMAPEVISGTVRPGAGHLVDVYALGVVAFELLTGKTPFDGEFVAEVLNRHVTAPVPDVRAVRADVPEGLATLVTQLLSKDPTRRPQSAEDVHFRLRALRASLEAAVPRRPFSVLIVDDDKDMLKVLGFYTRKALPDADVRIAEDGEQAVQRVREREPDVMLLDLHMPKMNGVEVCMYLRGAGLATRCTIVSVSAGAQAHDVQLLHELGITHFVPKGQGLSERLAQLLKQIRAGSEKSVVLG